MKLCTHSYIISNFRHQCGPFPWSFCLSLPLWFSPPLQPLEIRTVNLQGWRTGQVGWPSAAWPWAEGKQSEGGGLSPGPWKGAQQRCPSHLSETCKGRWCCAKTRRTGLEVGWRASLEVRPEVLEHGIRSRRRGGHKQTCYDFDGSAMQAAGREGGNGRGWGQHEKHKGIKIEKSTLT